MEETTVYSRENSYIKKIAYSIAEVNAILGNSMRQTYSLLNSKSFPVLKVVGTKIIPIEPFHEWMDKNHPYVELPEYEPMPAILVYEKKTYTVPEIRKMLGMKKTSSYELIKTGVFEIVMLQKNIRVKKDSFDRWFHSQDDFFSTATAQEET